jgi:hypothetical protein
MPRRGVQIPFILQWIIRIKWNFADSAALNFEQVAQKVACRRHCPI